MFNVQNSPNIYHPHRKGVRTLFVTKPHNQTSVSIGWLVQNSHLPVFHPLLVYPLPISPSVPFPSPHRHKSPKQSLFFKRRSNLAVILFCFSNSVVRSHIVSQVPAGLVGIVGESGLRGRNAPRG